MAYQGTFVIDADTHVFEPAERLVEYMDSPFRERTSEPATRVKLNPQPAFGGAVNTFMPGQRNWKRSLGVKQGELPPDPPTGAKDTVVESSWIRKPATDCNVNAVSRIKDMDEEGVDVAVSVPTAITGAAVLDVDFEQALYKSFHRWFADYSAGHSNRLKGVMIASLRDVEGTVAEIRRVAKEKWCVGMLLGSPPDGLLLDDPDFHPIWAAAQEADFALIQHCFTPRPPHFPGKNDMGENSFLAGTCSMPFAAMRNTAALVGGGIFDKFTDLRFGILEAGSGWFPAFMSRADHSAKIRHQSVPFLKSKPSDFLRGPRFFLGFGFEEDAATLNYVADALGDGHLVYGSDYCHPECHFPESVRRFVSMEGVAKQRTRELLGDTAKRLYRRI